MINKKVYSLMEAYYQVYENEILDEVTGKGAIDPGSNFPNHRERNTRTHQQAGMAMSPLERAMRREKALRSRGNTKATQRANQIKSRFIRPTERGIVRAIDSGNRADFNARQRMSESIDTYDVILDYLISEGLVETEYNAVQIMAHMSDEWADSIIESYYSLPLGKVMRKVSDLSRTSEKFRSDSSVRNQAKKSGHLMRTLKNLLKNIKIERIKLLH